MSEKSNQVSLIIQLMNLSAKKTDIAGKLGPMLNSIINDNLLLSPIIHPLGFVHADLGNDDWGRGLRLHIWEDSIDIDIQNKPVIHQHNRDIRSLVLCGMIVNQVYHVNCDSGPATHSVYEVCYDRKNGRMDDIIKYSGHSARASINYDHTHFAGEYYDLDTTLFHRSFVNRTFAATLVLAGKKQVIRPRILGKLHGLSEFTYTRRSLDKSAFKVLVQRLSKELKV